MSIKDTVIVFLLVIAAAVALGAGVAYLNGQLSGL